MERPRQLRFNTGCCPLKRTTNGVGPDKNAAFCIPYKALNNPDFNIG